jgi:hypothetical protein
VQDKPVQGQLRHAKAEITRNVYMQQVDPKTYEAMVNLADVCLVAITYGASVFRTEILSRSHTVPLRRRVSPSAAR